MAQKNEEVEEPTADDIYNTGVVAQILRVLKMPDGNTTIIIQGKKRFEIVEMLQEQPYLKAVVQKHWRIERFVIPKSLMQLSTLSKIRLWK